MIQMRLILPLLTILVWPALLWPQQPIISIGAQNGAAYGTAVAPCSIFIVAGLNLGPSELVQASAYPLLSTLAGTSIEVTIGGTIVPAYMIYTSSRQVAAVLPSRTPTGEGTLTVSRDGARSSPRSITVGRNHFGTFTNNASGRGAAVIQNVAESGTLERNVLTRPAHSQQTVTLYGTGLGAVEGDEGSGPFPAVVDNLPIEVYVGGQRTKVLYAGRSGCCPGLDQINFVVPDRVEGCHVPVLIKVEGALSNTSTMAVAAPGAPSCSDTYGRTADQLIAAQENGTLSEANIVLRQVRAIEQSGGVTFRIEADFGSATFGRQSFNNLQLSTGFSLFGPPASPGACHTWRWGQFRQESIAPDPIDVVSATPLDAGSVLTLTGPKGTRSLMKGSDGSYMADLSLAGGPVRVLFLEPGSWSIANGNGGEDVRAFQAQVTVPPGMLWTNEASTTIIQRSRGYEAQWTGATADSLVSVTGYSGGVAGVAFTCFERGDAGRLTVPAYILEGLANLDHLSVAVSTSTRFTATGLGAGRFTYVSGREKPVIYR